MVIRKDQPFDGACYHIVMRGNNRSYIFEKDSDKKKFLYLLEEYKTDSFQLFHYCLMDNHIHLLIRLLHSEQLAKSMQGICQSFTNHWKRTRDFVGCLWQGPYRRFLIGGRSYLLECGRYIERNPVRARMVRHPSEYPWSSFNAYAHAQKNPLVDLDPEFLGLSPKADIRRKLYREYVILNRPYEDLLDAALKKHTLRRFDPWQEASKGGRIPKIQGGEL